MPPQLALDVLIALSEAATNAVLHAYEPGSAGRIRVLGQRGDDELELAVEDDGVWRDRSAHHDGRGLAIIEAVSSTANIERARAAAPASSSAARYGRRPPGSTDPPTADSRGPLAGLGQDNGSAIGS